MFNSFQFLKKATMKIVAFSLLSSSFMFLESAYGSKKNSSKITDPKIIQAKSQFDEAQKKITSLMLLKQRTQALEIVDQLENEIKIPDYTTKIQNLRMTIITTFLSSEAQDYFELAATIPINQSKLALKNSQKCLNTDAYNFMCLWAEAKSYTGNSNAKYLQAIEKLKIVSHNLPELQYLLISLNKNSDNFLNMKIDSNFKSDLYNYQMLHLILEFDRSIKAKNYSLAQESLAHLQKVAPDYIDLIIMKSILEQHAGSDEVQTSAKAVFSIYKKRCDSATADVIRKYFFDIDFCKRSLE